MSGSWNYMIFKVLFKSNHSLNPAFRVQEMSVWGEDRPAQWWYLELLCCFLLPGIALSLGLSWNWNQPRLSRCLWRAYPCHHLNQWHPSHLAPSYNKWQFHTFNPIQIFPHNPLNAINFEKNAMLVDSKWTLVNHGNGNRISAQSKGGKKRLFCGECMMHLLGLTSAITSPSQYCLHTCACVINKNYNNNFNSRWLSNPMWAMPSCNFVLFSEDISEKKKKNQVSWVLKEQQKIWFPINWHL